jgi:hypothetical protein
MSYNAEKMTFKRTPRPVTLWVKIPCNGCGKYENKDCNIHDASVEDVELKVVGIPWAKLNYVKSQCVSFDESNKKTTFDGQHYINECLKLMITEAPWGETSETFLLTVEKCLGDELEKLVPSAESSSTTDEDFSRTKKELAAS